MNDAPLPANQQFAQRQLVEKFRRGEFCFPEDKANDRYYMYFTNGEKQTKFRLTGEAMQAVVALYASALRDQAEGTMKSVWNVTVEVSDEMGNREELSK